MVSSASADAGGVEAGESLPAKQIGAMEDQYHGIFEAAGEAMLITNLHGNVVEANPAACELFGYTHEELVGLPASALLHPADLIPDSVLRQGVRLRKGGSLFHAEARATALSLETGRHAVVVVRDITERVSAYELLERRHEERTRELSALLGVTHNVSSTLELRPLMEVILDQLQEVVEYAGASVSLIEGDESRIVAFQGAGSAAVALDVRFPLQQSALFQLWRGAGPLVIDDVRHDDTPEAAAFRKDDTVMMDDSFAYVRSWMAVPMVVNDRLLGILTLNGAEPGLYTPHQAELVLGIAGQAAIAIENARLYERSEQRTRELATLLNVSTNVSSTLELQPLLGLILDQLKVVVNFDGATVMAMEGENLVNLYRQGPGRSGHVVQQRFLAASHELLWNSLQRAEPVIIGDVRGDTPLAEEYRQINGELLDTTLSYVRSWMGVPMVLKERVIGVLSLASSQANFYTPHDASLVRSIANQAAIAIENARLYEQTVQRTSELSALLDVSRTVASTLELEPLLDLILDQLDLVAENDGITLLEVRGDEFVVLLRRVPGHEDQEFPQSYSTQSHGPVWDMVRQGKVVIIGDVRGDDPIAQAYRQTVGDYLNTSLSFERSFMAVPLMLKDQIIGLLGLTSARSDHYTPHHGEIALAIAQQAAVAIENARLYQKAQDAAVLEERQRLSRELHDSVSQALYGIVLGAQTARTLAERDPARAIAPLDYVVSLAQTGLAEMRALIFELRPETLEQEGLMAALHKQAEAISIRHAIQVTTVACDEPDVPLAAKEALYRIAREALHNTVKHAEATEVRLSLERAGEEIILAIGDNGKGFDTAGSFPGHLGLHSMQERAQRAGGTLEIRSTVGAGTTIAVRIPLRTDRDRLHG